MKYLFSLLLFLIAVVLFVLFLLFTQSGNNIIKPYLERYIQKELQKDVQVEAFTLRTNFIDLLFTVDKNSKFTINGDIDILKKSFDLGYIADANNLNTPHVSINGALHVEGRAKGDIKNMQITGIGEALKSQIEFLTNIENRKIKDIQIDAKNVKIEDILAFVKKPTYSSGVVDIETNIVSKGQDTYKGKSDIIIHYATLNNSLLESDFGIKLDRNITYKGTIKANIDGNKLEAKTNIESNIATIKTKNTQYDLQKNLFYSDYIVRIPKLGALKESMQGSITLDGNIQKTKDDFSFDINSKTLGGDIQIFVVNDTLRVDAKEIQLPLLSEMFKQPRYSDGNLNLSLDMRDTRASSRDGELTLHVEDGALHVERLMQTKRADKVKYKLSLNSNIVKDDASIDSLILSNILELNISKSNYNIKNNTIKGEYDIEIADLNNLYFITGRPLKGDLQVRGNYRYNKGLYLDGNSSFLDAKTTFILQDNLLSVNSDDLSTAEVADTLYYPKIFDSFSTLEANYNFTSEVGEVSISALNGKLLKSELTDLIYVASGFDLTTEIYKDTLLHGIIDKKEVDFSLLMNGLQSYLKIPSGHINLETNKIDSKFSIKIEHRDFEGKIKGSLEEPTVSLSGSKYIKQKLNKAIEKNVPEEWQDTAKELLKLFN